MSDKSRIEWTDATWNPVTGCTKVSSGCRNCYALRDWSRLSANPGTVYFGRAFTDVRAHAERLDTPLRWKRPRRIFVNSMSDLFHAAVPDAFIDQVFEVMERATHHTFQVLTKRAERMRRYLIDRRTREVPRHIWIGVSAEDQLTWHERVPWLLAAPVTTRFLSAEPLLGSIDGRGRTVSAEKISIPLTTDWPIGGLSWVIVGGESGPKARPSPAGAVRWLRDQCHATEVPFFFKQWGEWVPVEQLPRDFDTTGYDFFKDGAEVWVRAGKKRAGRALDGVIHDGMPA